MKLMIVLIIGHFSFFSHNSMKFCGNIKIPWKGANSAAQNSTTRGKLGPSHKQPLEPTLMMLCWKSFFVCLCSSVCLYLSLCMCLSVCLTVSASVSWVRKIGGASSCNFSTHCEFPTESRQTGLCKILTEETMGALNFDFVPKCFKSVSF